MRTRSAHSQIPGDERGEGRGADRLGRSGSDLISLLRAVQEEGREAMIAVDQYDPNFAKSLAASTSELEAVPVIDNWLTSRQAVLDRTRDRIRSVWAAAQSNRCD